MSAWIPLNNVLSIGNLLAGGDVDEILRLDSETGYEPADPTDVRFELTFELRIHGQAGIMFFYSEVCTPKYANWKTTDADVILVQRYSHTAFKREFLKKLDRCRDDDSFEAMKKLRNEFTWEYEDIIDDVELEAILSR